MTEFHATRNTEKGGSLHAGENKRERERERGGVKKVRFRGHIWIL